MTRITIEVDGGGTVHTTAAHAPQSSQVQQAAAAAPPAEVAAQAAEVGAINGGPAPSLGGVGAAVPPIPASIGGTPESPASVSAGSAKPQAFGSQGCNG